MDLSRERQEGTVILAGHVPNLCKACLRMFSNTTCVKDIRFDPPGSESLSSEYTQTAFDVLAGGHWADPDGCRAAAALGCAVCYVVFERFCILFDKIITVTKETQARVVKGHFTEYQIRPWERRRGKRRFPSDHEDMAGSYVLEITFESIRRANGLPVQFDVTECMVEFLMIPTLAHPRLFQDRASSGDTGSLECWERAAAWLSTCERNHAACKADLDHHRFHPTRLLDIGLETDSTIVMVRGTELQNNRKYIALSHKWGPNMLVLEDRTLPSRFSNSVSIEYLTHGIPVDKLTHTFRDAVIAARRLGVGYLWIDALCIVQNSEQDWNRESVQMHNVYGHAFCTIAGTSDAVGGSRLFHPRSPHSIRLAEVTLAGDEAGKRYGILPLDFWRVSVHDAALNRRGWVLQERILSPRILHFGRHQILWECNECELCETFPDGLPELLQSDDIRIEGPNVKSAEHVVEQRTINVPAEALGSSARQQAVPDDACNLTEAFAGLSFSKTPSRSKLAGLEGYALWGRIVEKYCTCRLTYGKDKLLAISGVAKRMESILEDLCFSGLWKNIMPSQLLWRVDTFDASEPVLYGFASAPKDGDPLSSEPLTVLASRAEQYRAPSWSWAALDSMIATSPPSLDEGCLRFVGASGKEQQAHEGGLPLVTTLIVKGALHFGLLQFEPLVRRWKLFVSPLGVRSYATATTVFKPQPVEHPNLTNLEQQAMGLGHPDAELNREKCHFVLCLPVMERTQTRSLMEKTPQPLNLRVSGLLLDPRCSKRGTYRRLGMFDLFSNNLLTNEFSSYALYQGMFDPEGNIVLV